MAQVFLAFPTGGVSLRTRAVPLEMVSELTNLLFVDEAWLVASGYLRSQCLLGLLDAFCRATGVTANAAK